MIGDLRQHDAIEFTPPQSCNALSFDLMTGLHQSTTIFTVSKASFSFLLIQLTSAKAMWELQKITSP